MFNCPRCTGKRWYSWIDSKTGLQKKKRDGRRGWRCYRCGEKVFDNDVPFIPTAERNNPNILYLDVEISLSDYYNYGARVPSKYMDVKFLKSEYFMISWAASWVGKQKVYSSCITQAEALKRTDASILKSLWELMDSADLIAGHNVTAFDLKKIYTRFMLNGYSRPRPTKLHDTLKMARKLAFESNKLDYLGKRLGHGGKKDIRAEDWIEIMETGSQKILDKVDRYCRNDVIKGKAVLADLLGWVDVSKFYGSTIK